MQLSPPGDRISQLLHVVLIEICEKIISYTNELVISGLVCVTADGIEVCRVPFDSCIKRDRGNTSVAVDKVKRGSIVSESVNSGDAASFDQNGLISSDLSKDFGICGDLHKDCSEVGVANCAFPVSIKMKDLVKNQHSLMMTEKSVDDIVTGSTLSDSGKICLGNDLSKVRLSTGNEISSLVGNLGEIIMECWERITPEVLRVSELLRRLGELRHTIGNNGSITNHSHFVNFNLHQNVTKHNIRSNEEIFNSYDSSGSSSREIGLSPFTFQPLAQSCQAENKKHPVNRKAFVHLLRHKRKFRVLPTGNMVRGSKCSSRSSSARVVSDSGSHQENSSNTVEPNTGVALRTAEKLLGKNGLKLAHRAELDAVNADPDVNVNTFTPDTFQSMEEEEGLGKESSALGLHLEKELQVCDDDDADDKDNDTVFDNEHKSAKVRNSSSDDTSITLFERVADGKPFEASVSNCVIVKNSNGNGGHFINVGRNEENARKRSTSSDNCDDNSVNLVEEIVSFNSTYSGASSEVLPATNQNSPDTGSGSKLSGAGAVSSPELSMTSVDSLMFRMKRFDCSLCKASFSMMNNLQRHVKKVHGTARDALSRPLPLVEPVLDVLNVEPASDFRPSRSSRYRHLCVFCDAAFTFRTNLTRHMKKIHGKIPIDVADQPSKSRSVK